MAWLVVHLFHLLHGMLVHGAGVGGDVHGGRRVVERDGVFSLTSGHNGDLSVE